MNTGIVDLVALGVVAVIAGMLFLITIVRELAPAERRRWLLGIALGGGVIAFTLKISLIVMFSTFPDAMLSLWPRQSFDTSGQTDLADIRPQVSTHLTPYTWRALPEVAPAPTDNPTTPAKVALGKRLFYDNRLSADGSLACASCHEISPGKGGGDGRSTAIGIHGQVGGRNVPTVLNAAFQQVLFWDGRAVSLEDQAQGPLTNPIEMGMPSMAGVERKVRELGEYDAAFARAFSERPAVTADNIVKAIAAYERTLITPNSPYDRFVRGDKDALSKQQLRGMILFESTGCIYCHSGPNFSGASVFSSSVFEGDTAFRAFPSVLGTEFETRYRLTEDLGAASHEPSAKQGVWRIPSLRNVGRTGPYFHNGSVDNLEQAVRIMARVQLNKRLSNRDADNMTAHWSDGESRLYVSKNQTLSDNDVQDIVAFLKALNGELPESSR